MSDDTGVTSNTDGRRDLTAASARLAEAQALAEAQMDAVSMAEARRLARTGRTLVRSASHLSRQPVPLAHRRDQLYRMLVRSYGRAIRAARYLRVQLTLLLYWRVVSWFFSRYWQVMLVTAVLAAISALVLAYRAEIAALIEGFRQWVADALESADGGTEAAPPSELSDTVGGTVGPDTQSDDAQLYAAAGGGGN